MPGKQPARAHKKAVAATKAYTDGHLGRIASDDRLLTTILLAAEAFPSSRSSTAGAYSVDHAVNAMLPPTYEAAWLVAFTQKLVRELNDDPLLSSQLSDIPVAVGDGSVLRLLFNNLFPDWERPRVMDTGGLPMLSDRELEVLEVAASGRSYSEIAVRLNISIHTVRTHIKHIYRALEVNSTIAAVQRASALGYRPFDDTKRFVAAARDHSRDGRAFQEFCASVGAVNPPSDAHAMRSLASLGMLLIAFSAATAREIANSATPDPSAVGQVWEIGARGTPERTVGANGVGVARHMVIAPPHAVFGGFSAGHLFVAHDIHRPQGLNRAAITEFTPDGAFVRCFTGDCDVGTRLIGPVSLAFAADGALLASSGWLTDGILSFTAGGQRVTRFASGCFAQIAVGKDGNVYGARHTRRGGVSVLDASGKLLYRIGGEVDHGEYHGVAIDSNDNIWIRRDLAKARFIEAFSVEGNLLFSAPLPGAHATTLAVDRQDRVHVVCQAAPGVRSFGLDGEETGWIPLDGTLAPFSAAFGEDGRLWVCGREV